MEVRLGASVIVTIIASLVVLILVLVEVRLGGWFGLTMTLFNMSLNPCFGGS